MDLQHVFCGLQRSKKSCKILDPSLHFRWYQHSDLQIQVSVLHSVTERLIFHAANKFKKKKAESEITPVLFYYFDSIPWQHVRATHFMVK